MDEQCLIRNPALAPCSQADRRRARHLRCLHGAGGAAGRVLHALCIRRRDRLYAARPTRYRPRQHDGSRGNRGADPRPCHRASDRRRRYRLRQCAQCQAHRPGIRARRGQWHPDRGSGFSQTLRPSRQQGRDPSRRNVRQDPRGTRRAARTRHAHYRPHRRHRGRRFRARDRARRHVSRGRSGHAVRRGAENTGRSRPSDRGFGRQTLAARWCR